MGARRWAVAVLAIALLGACSKSAGRAAPGSSSAPPTTAASTTTTTAPACARPHPSGQSTETFDFQGTARSFQLYVPPVYDGTKDVPLVFDFHGFGSNAVEQMAYGDFKPLANRDDFLVVAPDGQGAARHFNLSAEPGLQDDIAMVGALLDHLEAAFCIDVKRVYSTGMSDGGAMTSLLACRDADRFAAFAPVAVVVAGGCDAARPVPIAAFSGTADPIVPFNGGKVNCCGGTTLGAAPDTMARWAAHDGCSPTFTEEKIGTEVTKRSWPGCPAGAEVAFYIVEGGGHTWPGAAIHVDRLGKTTTQIDASATIWDFFKAHPLP